MNQHLQSILDIIQQDEKVTAEQKNVVSKSIKEADKEFETITFKLDRTEKVKKTTDILLEETIAELEQKRKAVEAQNRELEIEFSLERVRTVAMSMNKPDDLLSICEVLFKELRALGFTELRNALIYTFVDEKNYFNDYDYSDFTGGNISHIPYSGHPVIERFIKEIKKANDAFLEIEITGNELNEWKEFRKVNGEADDPRLDHIQVLYYYNYSVGAGGIGISTYSSISAEKQDLLKRFRNVFDLAYRRYTDIQQAEAQAREAKIEAALEKVRSRSLSMHKSDELQEVVNTLFERLQELDIQADSANIAIFKEGTRDYDYWVASHFQKRAASFHMPYTELALTRDLIAARESGTDFSAKAYSFEEKNEWFNYAFKNTDFKFLSEERKQFILDSKGVSVSIAFGKNTGVQVVNYSGNLLSETEADILKRFSRVFEQAYTRFLDLQKAEAQAREARIETSLERVRSRTMAMHRSDELQETAKVMFQEIHKLGVPVMSCGYNIWNKDEKICTAWMSSEGMIQPSFTIPLTERPLFIHFYESKQKGETFFVWEEGGEQLEEHYKYMLTLPGFAETIENFIKSGFALPTFQINHVVNFTHGNLIFITHEPVPGSWDVFKRFAAVFDQTYTRFLDLQKAEAQAREAQIELGLERVRARAMAMQKSDELADAAQLLYHEFGNLGINTFSCGYMFIDEQKQTQTAWVVLPDGSLPSNFIVFPLTGDPVLNARYKDWQEKKPLHTFEIQGKANRQHHRFLSGHVPSFVVENIFSKIPDRIIFHCANFSDGYLLILATELFSPEDQQTIIRFAKVFEMTYTRFLDLQKAEAQAREAQIELGLERVRARAMAMQKSDEVREVVAVVFQQMQQLGFHLNLCNIILFDTNSLDGDYWVSFNEQAVLPQNYHIPYSDHPFYQYQLNAWKNGEPFSVFELAGEMKKSWDEILFTQTDIKKLPASLGEMMQKLDKVIILSVATKHGLVQVICHEPLSNEYAAVLRRFAKVFEQTYTRFLDLQKAEAQAREAQIQLGLERVRARAMAMQNSDELNPLIGTVFVELTKLDLQLTRCVIMIIDPQTQSSRWWMANSEAPETPMNFFVKYHERPPYLAYLKGWHERKLKWEYIIEGTIKKEWDDFIFSETELSLLPDFVIAGMRLPERVYLNASFNNFGNLTLASLEPLSIEHADILLRFAKVFDLTYTRFNDLQKAEAQAREAQIEAALEKVRSRSLAMHKSDELNEVILVVFEKLKEFNVVTDGVALINLYAEGTRDVIQWIANPELLTTGCFNLPYFNHPILNSIWEARESGKDFVTHTFDFEEKNSFWNYTFQHSDYKYLSDDLKKILLESEGYGYIVAFEKYSSILVCTYTKKTFSADAIEILKRFAKVFEQAYIRFLDLQKAEEQAREAQIEAALEKVRSAALAMHHTDEMEQVVASLFERLVELGLSFDGALILLFDKGKRDIQLWIATVQLSAPVKINLPYDKEIENNRIIKDLWHAIETGEHIFNKSYSGETKDDYFRYTAKYNESRVPESVRRLQVERESWTAYFVTEKNSMIGFDSWLGPITSITEADFEVLLRFARVFEQAYTRFLDLQKAEAQAREATIEASLERVRGKAMSMHSSEDLAATIQVFYHEMESLSVTPRRCGVGLLNKETRIAELSSMNTTEQGESIEVIGKLNLAGHPVLAGIYENWLLQKEYHPVLRGNEIKEYYQLIRPQIAYPDYPTDTAQYGYFFFFNEGGVYAWTDKELSEDELQIYRRFTSVLSLTYKRYKDLKQAEFNTREAIRRASLDRIRADIASMRTTTDLERITPLIWNELTILGIPFIRCGIFIMDDSQELIHTFLSTPEGKAIAAFHLPYTTPGNIAQVLRHWQNKKNYVDHWDESAFTEFAETLVKQGSLASPEQYLKTIPRGGFYLHFVPFLQGMLYVGNTTRLGEDEVKLVQSIADAFSTAYARYEDFNKLESAKEQIEKTLVDLKQAQTQLIQSEKMASLGELTAGIAHEIQNPLNFVNNFSEVNAELLVELKDEISKGNMNEAKNIANDLIDNEEKINHHGKRADAIVKGMLQHSRISSGQKELTNINTLADEYLRLAYHGMRAKDNFFNVVIKTDFDESIGKIKIIQQDIGRVILNLITNAFYAVNEKKKQQPDGYEPIVTVSTKKLEGKVEITVSDNANGIPEKVLDKIFQPFFTTKPTGQGTGLGLSLSYDIVKAHGGEIKAESKEGNGTALIIELPIK